jgi:CDGSH iron-sulfur domain-containing protein 3
MNNPVVCQKAPIIQEMPAGTYWWCACGRSAQQPFCDGSHKGTEFGPQQVELKAAGKVAWCACKHSRKAPFCDGTHRSLA